MSEVSVGRNLLRELEIRKRRNAGYSLRAFARDLSINPQTLSNIMNGRRGASAQLLKHICEKLKVSPQEMKEWILLAHSQSDRSKQKRHKASQILQKQKERLEKEGEFFDLIASWQNIAILTSYEVYGLDCTPQFMAKKLGLTLSVVKTCINNLISAKVLEADKDGNITKANQIFVTAPTGVPQRGLREFNFQHLKLANHSLENHPVATRDFSTLYFGFSPADIEKARTLIKKFRNEFEAEVGSLEASDREIYALGVQFFPITH